MDSKLAPQIVLVIGVLAAAAQSAYAQHSGDIWVGRTGDEQLAVSGFPLDEAVAALPPVAGILQGFADDNPGFDRLVAPEPADDPNLFPLESGAQIWLEVVEFDPALRLIDNSYQILDDPGENTLLGGATLHVHMTWHININDPAYDPDRLHYRATFFLRDAGETSYADSELLTLILADTPHTPGDVNDDGEVNSRDIDAFVAALTGGGGLSRAALCAADANFDGVVNSRDIDAFVALLVSSDAPAP